MSGRKDKLILGIFFSFLAIFLYCSSILYSYFAIDMDIIANILIILGIISLIIYLYFSFKVKKFKIWNIIILLIFFFLYLSYYFAFDKYVALRGFYGGREGLFVIFSYYLLFLLATMFKKSKERSFFLVLITVLGIFNVIYGALQVLDIHYIASLPVARNWSVSSGFLFNPDFFGTFMIILVGLWLPKFLLSNKFKILNLVILLIFILGVFISGTMGSFLTLIFLFIIAIIYTLYRRKSFNKKVILFKYFLVGISSFTMFILVSLITNDNLKDDVLNMGAEFSSVVAGDVKGEFGTGRIYIWKEALKYFPKYIYTGIGIDNFAYLGFDDNTFIYDSYLEDNIVYKAHNEFLQILVTEGIFTFIFYLIFLFLIVVISFKKLSSLSLSSENQILCLFFTFIGYLFQAIFNIRIILIAPFFFILSGFLVADVTSEKE